jgi:hypothetical protein
MYICTILLQPMPTFLIFKWSIKYSIHQREKPPHREGIGNITLEIA